MPNYAAPKVTKIEFLEDMKIKLFFDGKTKVVDIGDSDLPEKEFFKKAVIDGGSLAWDDLHVDIDELIYECSDVTEKELPATVKKIDVASSYVDKEKLKTALKN